MSTKVVTAAAILVRVMEYGPKAVGCDLEFDQDVPDFLCPLVRIFQTGIRSIITGKKWFSNDANGHGTGLREFGALDPRLPIPMATTWLAVEGDPGWDKVRWEWKEFNPECFVTAPAPPRIKTPSRRKLEGVK